MMKFTRLSINRRIGCCISIICIGISPLAIVSCSIQAENNGVTIAVQRNFAPIKYERQAEIVRNLLLQNEFVRVEEILNEALDKQWLTRGGSLYAASVLDRLFERPDPKFLIILERWIEQNSESTLSHTVRAYFYYQYAWSFRGTKYTNRTPEEAIQKYIQQIVLCRDDLDRALSLDPDNPLALFSVLRVGRNTKMSLTEFDRYFTRTTEIVPFFNQAYQEKALYLAPNWHGDTVSLLVFAKSAMSAPRGTAIPLLLPQAHDNVCNYHRSCRKSEYYRRAEVWQDIESSYMRLIEDFPRSGVYAYWFAQRARKAGKMRIAKQYYRLALSREPNNKTILDKASLFKYPSSVSFRSGKILETEFSHQVNRKKIDSS